MSQETPDSSADDGFDYVHVFENVGTRIYKYFEPHEIYRFSLANRHIREHVGQHLIPTFQQNFHLPLSFDLGHFRYLPVDDFLRKPLQRWLNYNVRRTKAMFSSNKSFTSKDALVSYVVQHVLGGSGLQVAETQSAEESAIVATYMLITDGKVRVELSDRAGSVRLQPNFLTGRGMRNGMAEIGEGWLTCQYSESLNSNAAKILVESNFQGSPGGYKMFARAWLHYLLSQPDTITRYWRWIFMHPNNIETIMTVGLVITNRTVGDNITVTFRTKA